MIAAEALEFERAAGIRDRIDQMRSQMGKSVADAESDRAPRGRRGRKKPGSGGGRIPQPKRGV